MDVLNHCFIYYNMKHYNFEMLLAGTQLLRTNFRIYQAFGGKSRKIDLSQFLSTNSHWLVKKHHAFFSRSERLKFEKPRKTILSRNDPESTRTQV